MNNARNPAGGSNRIYVGTTVMLILNKLLTPILINISRLHISQHRQVGIKLLLFCKHGAYRLILRKSWPTILTSPSTSIALLLISIGPIEVEENHTSSNFSVPSKNCSSAICYLHAWPRRAKYWPSGAKSPSVCERLGDSSWKRTTQQMAAPLLGKVVKVAINIQTHLQ